MKAKFSILSFLAFFYAASLFAQSSVNITFRVNITNYLNAGNNLSPQGIRIAGNFATYGVANHEDWAPWDPNGIMQPEGNNWWNKTITFPASAIGQTFQYKFVNGGVWGDNENWQTTEGNGCVLEDGSGFINRALLISNTNATVSYCWDECNTACATIEPNGTFQYQISSTIQNCQGNNLSISVSPLTNISTNSITSITSSSALSGGAIINDGGNAVSQRGVCWNTSPNPTTANFTTSNGSGLGNFSSNLTDLSPNTTYYVRAYAINSAGTFYGNEVSLITSNEANPTAHSCGAENVHNPSLNYGSMTDQEGNTYKTIVIGTQEWMAENLKTSIYRNGDPIPNVTNYGQWAGLTSGAWCYYNNDPLFECPYAKLYNWYAVADARAVCPIGWHIPTDGEWTTLTDYLGGEAVAGGKMKSIGTQYWINPNQDATNESGFSGLPGGFRDNEGFYYIGVNGNWWSSTQYWPGYAWDRNLYYDYGGVTGYSNPKWNGFSVRCLRD